MEKMIESLKRSAKRAGIAGLMGLSSIACGKEVQPSQARIHIATYGDSLPTSVLFHETGKLEDGSRFGKLGAIRYLLNQKGEPISAGFHEIIPTDSGYSARLGDFCNYKLNKKGEIIETPVNAEECTRAEFYDNKIIK